MLINTVSLCIHYFVSSLLLSNLSLSIVSCEMSNLRVYTTDKGKEGLIYNDFCYREVRKRAADGGIFWRCIHKGCPGRMNTTEDKDQVEYDGGHNHQSDPNEVAIREVKTRARKRARTETTPMPAIYSQEVATLATLPAAAANMPTYLSVSKTLYRERRSLFPALPTSCTSNACDPSTIYRNDMR
jgi:hypothetical protein